MTFSAIGQRRLAFTTVVALCATIGSSTLLWAPAASAASAGSAGSAVSMLTEVTEEPPAPGSEAAALAEARASHVAQVVDDLTTPTSETTANPDGSFTLVRTLLPTRVEQSGAWVPVDPTLQLGPDGRVHPHALPTDVTFSPGGTAPLVQVTSDAGEPLSISYPDPLPAPVLDGNTATYPEVMPGVNLVVTATDDGGFSEVLAVKDRAAAANPDLARIDFHVAAAGLNITHDATTGALQGTDGTGQLQFTAPTPLMWDSSVARTPGEPTGDPAGDLSDGSTPGDQAQTTPIDVDPGAKTQAGGITTQTLSVQPDQDMLAAADTVYPVYVDPFFAPLTVNRQHFTWVQSGCPTSSNYDSQAYDPGVGLNGFQGCVGVERAYYQIDTSDLDGATINDATLKTTVTYSAQFCPATTVTVNAYYSYGFTSVTNWNTKPGAVTAPNDDADSAPATHCQGQGGATNVNFDVTKSVRRAAANGYPSNTYRLSSDANEGNQNAFKRFGDNPTLAVHYDRPPNVPTNLTTTPAPVNGWIGATNSATPVTLQARVTSGVPQQMVYGVFTLKDTTSGTTPLDDVTGGAPGKTSGSNVSVNTPTLTNGHDYTWYVYTSDGILHSAAANGGGFGVDTTPPALVSITSSDYPAAGSSTPTTKHAGAPAADTTGAFTINATDDHSGIARIDWQLTPLTAGAPAAGATSGSKTFAGSASGAATATISPGRWGTNILFARVVDRAGNTSQTKQYVFYAPADPDATRSLGDITGDHVVDLVTTTTDGRLRVYPATKDPGSLNTTNTDPAAGPYIASAPEQAPDGTTWSGSILTHRGSLTSSAYVDDLFAAKNGILRLYSNTQNTTTGAIGFFSSDYSSTIPHPACTGTCTGYPTSWADLTAMVAPGDVTGDGLPDLVTIEGGRLWLYHGTTFKQFNNPLAMPLTGLTGAPVDTAHADLLAPFDADHNGSSPDLWIRDRVTGTITQFNGTGTTTGLATTGTIVATGYTGDSTPVVFTGGDYLHNTTTTATTFQPSIITLTGAGTLQLRETPTSAASLISTATFGSAVAAVENQPVKRTRNVYVPVTPTRLVDTRSGGGGTLTSSRRAWPVTGTANVPATGVTAVAINVVALNASTEGTYVRFGDNGPATATSTLNTPASTPVSNSVVVVPDDQGRISAVTGSSTTADVLVDVVGYYTDQSDADTAGVTGSYFVPLAGARACDSRLSTGNAPGCGDIPAAGTRTVTIAGTAGVPLGATAVTANITIVSATATTSVVAWAAGTPRPGITSAFAVDGQSASTTSQIQLNTAGQLSLFSSAGTQDVVIDIQGYYLPSSTPTASLPTNTSTYVPVPPARILYTDDPSLSGTSATPLGTAARTLKITGATDSNGQAVIPPSGVCGAVYNLTAVHQSGGGYLKVAPQGTAVSTSLVTYPAGPAARSNLAMTKLSASGSIDITNQGPPTDVFVDILGYLLPLNGTC